MAILVTLRGPELGRHFPLQHKHTTLGRQVDCTICLSGKLMSRQHARILQQDGSHFVEDLGSSNGTFLNGRRLSAHAPTPLTERDTLQVGPYVFALRAFAPPPLPPDPPMVVRESISAVTIHQGLLTQDPAAKLQVVLEIAQHLARTLDLDALLDKLVEQLMRLFPQVDRALVILCDEDRLVVAAQRGRPGRDVTALPFSRTIIRQALNEGVGILSDDVQKDQRFLASATITSLDLHSVLCVPLIDPDGKRLGAIQLDRFSEGLGFRSEDLQMLAAVGMQVTVVLDNTALHARRLQEERLRQELMLAQDIQQGFLPEQLDGFPGADFDIHGRVFPARQVAGDLYDFFKLPSGRLAFFIGDVSGKGMPAALFMVAVRTLCRHLAKVAGSPAQILARLNAALADDNPSCMFVTLAHGTYHPASGEVLLTSAGHHPPILRRADGTVEPVELRSGRLLGYDDPNLRLVEVRLVLEPGDLLFFFTDGLVEARGGADRTMFGINRLVELVRQFTPTQPLADCAEQMRAAVVDFTASPELQDDLTLLMLRRGPMD